MTKLNWRKLRYHQIGSATQVQGGRDATYHHRMRIKETRLLNLRILVDELGGITQVANASGLSQKYLSQVINGHPLPSGKPRGIGDAAARKLEEGCGKADGWMDAPHQEAAHLKSSGDTLSPTEREIVMLYRKSDHPLKFAILNVCRLANTMKK